MTKRVSVLIIVMLVALAAGCSRNDATTNLSDNANTATATSSPTTVPAPDNSELTTSVDASGTRTETRVFRDNRRISRVVVTTRNGQRTVKAYSPSGEERVVNMTEDVLQATGNAVADAAGFVADKGEDVAGEAGDKAEDVGDKTVSGAKKVGKEAADKAEDVGDKTVSGAKKVGSTVADKAEDVGDKTVSGAKKVGSATKKGVKKIIP